MAPMRKILVALALLIASPPACMNSWDSRISAARPSPSPDRIAYFEYSPPSGQGRVVIILSGGHGPNYYSAFASQFAVYHGYDVVLLDGNDFRPYAPGAGENLRQTILRAQRSPHASPGKVAVIGLSAGGGDALAHASTLPDLVSLIVAFYPNTRSIPNKADVVRRWEVPTLVFAGTDDVDYDYCCTIETIRAMAVSAKDRNAPFELVEYRGAGHSFNLPGSGNVPSAAEDSWRRTLAVLKQHLGP
jgi:pimeloyl-ACP methyl ester carboxylesterase